MPVEEARERRSQQQHAILQRLTGRYRLTEPTAAWPERRAAAGAGVAPGPARTLPAGRVVVVDELALVAERVQASPGRLRAIRVFHRTYPLCDAFVLVWACRVLNSPFRLFLARAGGQAARADARPRVRMDRQHVRGRAGARADAARGCAGGVGGPPSRPHLRLRRGLVRSRPARAVTRP
jgi:hypothetical protein